MVVILQVDIRVLDQLVPCILLTFLRSTLPKQGGTGISRVCALVCHYLAVFVHEEYRLCLESPASLVTFVWVDHLTSNLVLPEIIL